jgi:NitT/TauT family transport system substrate-binding protein
MKKPIAESLVAAAIFALGASLMPAASLAAKLTQVKMSIDEDPIVLRIAESLGYLAGEGIEIIPVDLERLAGEDYLMQEPLMKGQLDASYHWFNHAIFGARHGFPVKAVMVFNDAPGMTVMVANRVKDDVRGVADFKGRRIAEGAGYGTKAVITNYLTGKAGLAPHSYTPVMLGKEGRQEAVIQGLKDGTVDVMTFQEPVTSALLATNMVTKLYDLNSKETTSKVLGAAFPAQCLLMSPDFIRGHPDTVQHLVNALVRALRFINSHSAEEIAAKLPPAYFGSKDREAEVKLLRDTLPTLARGDYSFSREAVHLVTDINLTSAFDASVEGQWRATGDKSKVHEGDLYTNRFVEKAMREIK